MGARFAKWRAVIAVGDGIPSRGCIQANAQALARYAALCQEASLVPIVEPEVLMDGEHTLERCREVTEEVLRTVFHQLYAQRVTLEGMILKPNMVLPGLTCPQQAAVDEVADATVRCLLRTVPAAVPGIAFLSGGQSSELASARLNAMNARFKSQLPWALAFSFSRAIQAAGSGDLARRGGPRRWRHSKLCIIEPRATGPRAVANTTPRWKGHEHDAEYPATHRNLRHGRPSKPITGKSTSCIFGTSERHTTASLRRKLGGAGDLQSVVRTMKAVAASSIGQYEQSVHALADYYRTVELGLGACLRESGPASLIAERKGRTVAGAIVAVVFGSDQGLVDQFNDVVADYAIKALAALPAKPEVWAVGERVHARLAEAEREPPGGDATGRQKRLFPRICGRRKS